MILHLLTMFVVQVVAYIFLVLNLRALNRGRYLMTGVTEVIYALMNFWIIHKIAEAKTFIEALVYASGATVGSLTAMYITKHWDVKKDDIATV